MGYKGWRHIFGGDLGSSPHQGRPDRFARGDPPVVPVPVVVVAELSGEATAVRRGKSKVRSLGSGLLTVGYGRLREERLVRGGGRETATGRRWPSSVVSGQLLPYSNGPGDGIDNPFCCSTHPEMTVPGLWNRSQTVVESGATAVPPLCFGAEERQDAVLGAVPHSPIPRSVMWGRRESGVSSVPTRHQANKRPGGDWGSVPSVQPSSYHPFLDAAIVCLDFCSPLVRLSLAKVAKHQPIRTPRAEPFPLPLLVPDFIGFLACALSTP